MSDLTSLRTVTASTPTCAGCGRHAIVPRSPSSSSLPGSVSATPFGTGRYGAGLLAGVGTWVWGVAARDFGECVGDGVGAAGSDDAPERPPAVQPVTSAPAASATAQRACSRP